MSEQTGFGYFRNFGETQRQGFELGINGQRGRVYFGTGYTFLSATFQSEETVNGESNGSNSEAEEGEPGLEGTIDIEPGDRMPFVPRHMIKAFADVRITDALWLTSMSSVSPAASLAATRTTSTSPMGRTTSTKARHPAMRW